MRSRRMTRAFSDAPVAAAAIDNLIDLARRAPTAGNTDAVEYLVLEGPDQTGGYWDVTLPRDRREGFAWPGLLNAPILILPFVEPDAYVGRYGEQDKHHTGLGSSVEAWATPYWWVDGGMAAMTILLGVEDYGLGALFFGVFDHEDDIKERFGVPVGRGAIGAIAVGHPTGPQRRSTSAPRPRRSLEEIVHRGAWRRNPAR